MISIRCTIIRRLTAAISQLTGAAAETGSTQSTLVLLSTPSPAITSSRQRLLQAARSALRRFRFREAAHRFFRCVKARSPLPPSVSTSECVSVITMVTRAHRTVTLSRSARDTLLPISFISIQESWSTAATYLWVPALMRCARTDTLSAAAAADTTVQGTISSVSSSV